MKIFIYLLPFLTFAQVGIGTTTPLNDLHVNGGVRIDDVPYSPSTDVFVKMPNGDVGYNDNIGGGSNFLTSVTSIKEWNESDLDFTIPGTGYSLNDSILIQLERQVTVPVGKVAVIKINTTIPIEIGTENLQFAAKLGTRFLIDGVAEEKSASYFTIKNQSITPNFYPMETIHNFYSDWVNNISGSSPITVTYTVVGYVERFGSNMSDPIFRFKAGRIMVIEIKQFF